MAKRFIVRLTDKERTELEAIVSRGKKTVTKFKHAQILLLADLDAEAWTDEQIAAAVRCHPNTVARIRQRCVEEGLESALERKKQAYPSRQPSLDGAGEARLIALGCSSPPKGRAAWTLQLLADKLVELKIVESISHETVRKVLKKTNSGLTCRNAG